MVAKKLKIILFLCLISCFSLWAQKSTYRYCVESKQYESFMAEVYFMEMDFGERAALAILENELRDQLKVPVEISPYRPKTCPCQKDCQVLEVSAKDWDGNWNSDELNLNSVYGAAVEVTEMILSEGRQLFTNPGKFIGDKFTKERRRAQL